MGPGGQAQLQPAAPLRLMKQPRTQAIVSVSSKNIAQSLCKAGTSLRMLRYEPGLHVDGLEGCTFHCEAVLPQSKISAAPNVPATGRAREMLR